MRRSICWMGHHLRFFWRHRGAASDAVDASAAAGKAAGMPVVDRIGRAFESARASGLGIGLWRVAKVDDLRGLTADTAVLYAAYDWEELERGSALMRHQPTVVLGIGLGARAGSRALNLGAIGYLHDGLDRGQLCGALADALARQSYRRIRSN